MDRIGRAWAHFPPQVEVPLEPLGPNWTPPHPPVPRHPVRPIPSLARFSPPCPSPKQVDSRRKRTERSPTSAVLHRPTAAYPPAASVQVPRLGPTRAQSALHSRRRSSPGRGYFDSPTLAGRKVSQPASPWTRSCANSPPPPAATRTSHVLVHGLARPSPFGAAPHLNPERRALNLLSLLANNSFLPPWLLPHQDANRDRPALGPFPSHFPEPDGHGHSEQQLPTSKTDKETASAPPRPLVIRFRWWPRLRRPVSPQQAQHPQFEALPERSARQG